MKKTSINIEQKPNLKIKLIVISIILITIFFVSFLIGRFSLNPIEVIATIYNRATSWLGDIFGFIPSHDINKTFDSIVFKIRLPRILGALIIGAALSVSGASYQAVFKNPMVSPDILGASSGSAFGAALGIILGLNYASIALLSFGFGLASVFIAIFLSMYFRHDRTLGLVLSGIMVSSIFGAMLSFIKLVADTENELPAITYWLMGSLSGLGFSSLFWATIPILIGLIPIILLRWRLNAFTMGEDEAAALGINVNRMRLIIILSATLMTSASISISGMIGFIGLVIPHFSRLIFGQNYKYVITSSVIVGAGYLLLVDNFSRGIYTTEIPLGILTSFIGAPVFILLMIRRKRY